MSNSRSKINKIQIDERTATMPAEVITCRAAGHLWQRVPVPLERRKDLLDMGLVEWIWHCLSCGSVRNLVFSLSDGEPVGSLQINYAANYLLDKEHHGTGRLPRSESRKAAGLREVGDLL